MILKILRDSRADIRSDIGDDAGTFGQTQTEVVEQLRGGRRLAQMLTDRSAHLFQIGLRGAAQSRVDLDPLQKLRAALERNRTMAGLWDRSIIKLGGAGEGGLFALADGGDRHGSWGGRQRLQGTPHGLRHHGIAELANLIDTNGLRVGEGMKLSRHKEEETYRSYSDRTGTLHDLIIDRLAQRTQQTSSG